MLLGCSILDERLGGGRVVWSDDDLEYRMDSSLVERLGVLIH